MKIAVVAHIRYPIAEPFSGGMEAHTHLLCNGLRAAGHKVALFAPQGSDDLNLVPICDPYDAVLPWDIYRGTPRLAAYQDAAFRNAMREIEVGDYDVVHNNSLFPGLINWCAAAKQPCVTSLHVPPFEGLVDAVRGTHGKPWALVTVPSASQETSWEERGCEELTVVPNSVDTAHWQPIEEAGTYLTWTGRIVPNKGLSYAVSAARLAGAELRIYGPVEDSEYFTKQVEPWLGDLITYHGHLPADALRRKIAGAYGALITPMWDEPFGLVAAEALACGVPVAAFNRGALAEVVGPCGILVPGGDSDALAVAITQLGSIDRAACRSRACGVLSVSAMIERYERCYETAIEGADVAPSRSAAASSCASTTALLAKG